MDFKEFYIEDKNKKSNCVVRSICKILNKEYEDVFTGLCKTAKELDLSSFNDIPVFEKYMEDNGIVKVNYEENIIIKNLKLDNGSYIIFCYDKKDYYHMVPIINNIIYDKNNSCMELYVISMYRKK